ncbi:MAG: hypothetical protein A4E35_02130 [Methanoregula sp. PtaU1.Bin051]|nr:MAG: hypothetical protein A4E35_02130 [Methanoregula sp. PtaU1.Bin051]
MNSAPDTERLKQRDRFFTIGVPALAFGGMAVAIALQSAGVILDAGTFVWGSVAASFLLGYFAFIKPKKDIVAICTPIYGVILFLLPGDIPHTLLLQFLFAVSITILLLRLNHRFGSLADVRGGSPMEKFLREYIERIRPDVLGIPRKTAHEIASAFFAFKFGLYANAIEQCNLAAPALPDGKITMALKKALQIVKANAEDLENSQVRADARIAFSPDEKAFVAINLPQEKIEDPASLELDNALVMLYAVSMITSPEDEQALEEHQKFIIKILNSYKTALGIV